MASQNVCSKAINKQNKNTLSDSSSIFLKIYFSNRSSVALKNVTFMNAVF